MPSDLAHAGADRGECHGPRSDERPVDAPSYDRHVIPFCLATRAYKDADGTLTKWKLCEEWPKWAPAKYGEDKATPQRA